MMMMLAHACGEAGVTLETVAGILYEHRFKSCLFHLRIDSLPTWEDGG